MPIYQTKIRIKSDITIRKKTDGQTINSHNKGYFEQQTPKNYNLSTTYFIKFLKSPLGMIQIKR